MLCKLGFLLWITQALLCSLQAFPVANCAVHTREESQTLVHESRNKRLDLVNILHYMFYALLVERQGFSHIVKHTHKVHNDTAGLVVGIFAVGAADSLQQCMVLHWLVEIHTLQDRCVKTC